MQDGSNNEQVGTATDALFGAAILNLLLPFVLSLVLGYVLFSLPNVRSTESPPSPAVQSAVHASNWLQGVLLPAPLRNDFSSALPNTALVQKVRRGYTISVAFILFYAGLAALAFLMMFRLIIRNWREQSRSGAFNPERLRSLFYNFRELVVVFGCPAVIVLVFGFPGARELERALFAWTSVPGLDVPRWQVFLAFVGLFLHIANRWERETCLAHTVLYRIRFGAVLRSRRAQAPRLAKTLGMEYTERMAQYYNVKWVDDGQSGRLRPRWRSEWYTKGKPGAHPVYDVWKCGCGYAANIVHGEYDGHHIHLFDYHYCRDAVIHWGAGVFDFVIERSPRDSTVTAMELPGVLPSLSIYPKTVWDELAKYGGGIDLGMESFEFSETYRVWAQDRRFAFAVCNARMMELLSGHPGLALRIAGNVLALRLPGLVPLDRMVEFRDWLAEAYRLMPAFVFTDAALAQEEARPGLAIELAVENAEKENHPPKET